MFMVLPLKGRLESARERCFYRAFVPAGTRFRPCRGVLAALATTIYRAFVPAGTWFAPEGAFGIRP